MSDFATILRQRSRFTQTMPDPPARPMTEGELLRDWLNGRIAALGQPSRAECYSLALLLQHRYFYARWRSDPLGWDKLHASYEQCFRIIEGMLELSDPPLPAERVSSQGSPESDDPDAFLAMDEA